MQKLHCTTLRTLALVLSFAFSILAARAQQQPIPSTLTGPVPAQIAAAHTIFLTSAGTDPRFPIDGTRAYNEVYADLKSWGHYQLVSSPDQADLVFQLRSIARSTTSSGTDGQIYTAIHPAFELTIVDPHTGTPIWTINSPVALTGSHKAYDHWVAVSEENLISRILVLSGQPLTAAQTTDLTTFPKTHFTRDVLLLVGGAAALSAGGYFLIHHLYENSLANQKASKDAFCKANNIPLSMCAGG